jgi:protein-L-isoaspartate O-methyltransferase
MSTATTPPDATTSAPNATTPRSVYILGHAAAEQDRLIRQATILAPITERLFRDAGIGAGQRVLDVGAGVGDVSMIAARLVGSAGEVVGVERDAGSVARARERVAAAGFRNVSFTQGDVTDLAMDGPFDAAVGRMILSHVPDPVRVVRGLLRLLVPGGVVAFHEATWPSTLAASAPLPLWSRLQTAVHDSLARSGVNPGIGLDLCGLFQDAGLPVPHMHLDMPLATDAGVAEVKVELLRTLLPAAERHGVSLAELGDLDTLAERIHAEAVDARLPLGYLAMVGAWARKTA